MIITNITLQKNNKKRYSVFIDGNFAFGIEEIDLLYYGLKIGNEITKEKLADIIDNLIYIKAKDTAFKFISYKMRTKKEIIKKLSDDYNEEIILKIVEMLEKYNYINDKQFALSFTKEKIKLKGEGKIKIKFELKEKGVNEKIINEVFSEIEFEENDTIIKHIRKKVKKYEIDLKEKQRLLNFLLRKGFTYEEIKIAFKSLNIK